MTKQIVLTRDKIALVDDEDYENLLEYGKWSAKFDGRNYYARTRLGDGFVDMHRVIIGAKKGQEVDHINRDSLDNRKKNLRIATRSENMMNRDYFTKNSPNATGFKGVSFKPDRIKCYQAEIYHKGERHYLGGFKTAEDAALAYNSAAIELRGEYAVLNEI